MCCLLTYTFRGMWINYWIKIHKFTVLPSYPFSWSTPIHLGGWQGGSAGWDRSRRGWCRSFRRGGRWWDWPVDTWALLPLFFPAMWRTLALIAWSITCSHCTIPSSTTSSTSCMPHGSSKGWSAYIILQDFWGFLHTFCLKANLKFDIALRQAALLDGEVGLVTASASWPTCACTSRDCGSPLLLSVPLFVLLFIFFSTPSLFLSLPCRNT